MPGSGATKGRSSGPILVGSGVIDGGGGVGGMGIVGVAGRERNLNENFCFGAYLAFSDDNRSDSCFNCYDKLSLTRSIPLDIVFDRTGPERMCSACRGNTT